MGEALLALAPLAVLVLAMAAFELPTFRAALLALAVLAAVTALRAPPAVLPALWGHAAADTVVLTATVVYTLFFGLLLYQLLSQGGALQPLLQGLQALGRTPLERLLWVLLVFGPLFESTMGFGLGVVAVVPMLLGLGYAPGQTLLLSLISQLAVPWGALAIGMALGAAMVHLPLAQVGSAAALFNLPALAVFWLMALRLAGLRPTPAVLGRSALAVAVFGAGVWCANRWSSPELGGIAGAGLLAGWLWLSGAGLDAARSAPRPAGRAVLRAVLPVAVLVALLLVTRLAAPLRAWLVTHAVLRLPGSTFALPLLYNPGASLLLAALAAGLAAPRDPAAAPGWVRAALGATLRQWWPVARAVAVLVLIARVMADSGLTGALGAAGAALPSALSVGSVAPLAALGGFLTGSVAGANALFVELVLHLGGGPGAAAPWVLGLFNVLAAAFTAFSPARLVFAAVMTQKPGAEGWALRRMAPLMAALLLWGLLALGLLALLAPSPASPWLPGP